jgi:hypothetical protein
MSWPTIPERPDVAPEQIGTGKTRPRYEDIAQDGRMRLEGIWPPIGPILWGGSLSIVGPLGRLGKRGIRSVLTRVVLWGGSEPISVHNPVEHELRYRLAHSVSSASEVDRIVFETWLTSHAARGEPNDPSRAVAGQRVQVARAYGLHVFTRPAAPPGEHRVLELDDPELERVPSVRSPRRDALELSSLPEGAEPLEPEATADDATIAFGLAHTDGNQHVNFLAYPRLAEDAALRRISKLGFGSRRLARFAEVGYRKPCFAGQRVQILLRAFSHQGELGALASFVVEPDGTPDKPHCVVRLLFSE